MAQNYPVKKFMRYRQELWIAACYALITAVLTYPVPFRLASHIAGFSGEDNLQWRWFLWWFKHALLVLQTSFTNVSILFAPAGGEQPLYAITGYIPALALPITLLAGPTASFNLSFLLSFVLSAYTAHLLAYYLVKQRPAAFIAGLIFGFYPARFGYATGTFLGQLTIYFLPLYVLALLMLARRPTWRRAVWAGLVLACLCLTWPLHVAYGASLFTIGILGTQLSAWLRRPRSRANIKYYLLAFGLAFVLIIGPFFPLLRSTLQRKFDHLGGSETTYFATDLLAFIAPSNYHPLWQPLHLLPAYATRVLADRDDIQERLAYVGLVPILLAVVGLLKFRRRGYIWLLIALAAMLLSLGPLLKFNGRLVQLNIEGYVGYVVLPYVLLRSVPVLDWGAPLGRLNDVTMLCIGLMAAYGAAFILSSVRRGGYLVVVSGLSLLILLEFWTIFPFPTQPDVIPNFYYRLQEEGLARPQRIIDLPLVGDPSYTNTSMHYQTVHHQPIAGGHFMRKPAGASELTGFINQVISPPLDQPAIALPDAAARLGLLNEFGFTKIVVRPELMAGDEQALAQLAYLQSWLGEPGRAGEVVFFEIPPGGTPPGPITPLLTGSGWQPGGDAARLRLEAPADLLVYLHQPREQPVMLQLAVSALSSDRYLAVQLDARPAFRLYLSQEILNYRIPLFLSPGAHRFTFWPEEACPQQCAPVDFTRIALEPASTSESAAASFAGQLILLGHELSSETVKSGQPILLFLYWQGQNRMKVDYSVFVHLVAPDGRLAGQADYLLGGWHYPTSSWPESYITAMPSLFFLPPDTSPGAYELRAGIYDAGTGERLWVTEGQDKADSILLSTITVAP